MTTKDNSIEYQKEVRERFQKSTEAELIASYNREVGNPGWVQARAIYLHELQCEFKRRKWDFSVISNSSGGLNLAPGNKVYLQGSK